MAEVRRCSDCGNEILGWAEGVCYVCARNKRTYQRRNGLVTHQRPKRYRTLSQGEIKRSRIIHWTIREGHKREGKPVTRKSIQYSISTSDLVACREGFHRLIREVFGEGLHFCQLLKDLGYPSEKVDRWRDCEDWMCIFLKRFEKNLCDLMRRTFPDLQRIGLIVSPESTQNRLPQCGQSTIPSPMLDIRHSPSPTLINLGSCNQR